LADKNLFFSDYTFLWNIMSFSVIRKNKA